MRNLSVTWTIPVRAISSVDGGRRLTIYTTGGTAVTVAALSGDGLMIEAWRRTDAATQNGHLIRHAEDARLSRGDSSAATKWAEVIRARVNKSVVPNPAVPERRTNWAVVAFTIALVAVFVGTIVFV